MIMKPFREYCSGRNSYYVHFPRFGRIISAYGINVSVFSCRVAFIFAASFGCLFDSYILILLKSTCNGFIAGFSAQGINDGFQFVLLLAFLCVLVVKQRYLFDVLVCADELGYADRYGTNRGVFADLFLT